VIKFFLDSSAKAIQALIRDGYRCIVTSQYDSSPNSKKKWNVTEEEVIAAGGVCITRCAHIAPDSMYFNENNLSNKVEVWLFPGFLVLITYLCIEGVCCLCAGSPTAVWV
jgi:hypothetical protein